MVIDIIERLFLNATNFVMNAALLLSRCATFLPVELIFGSHFAL